MFSCCSCSLLFRRRTDCIVHLRLLKLLSCRGVGLRHAWYTERTQVLPVVNHQLLNGDQCVIAYIGIIVRQQTHHGRLAMQLLQHTVETQIVKEAWNVNETHVLPRG